MFDVRKTLVPTIEHRQTNIETPLFYLLCINYLIYRLLAISLNYYKCYQFCVNESPKLSNFVFSFPPMKNKTTTIKKFLRAVFRRAAFRRVAFRRAAFRRAAFRLSATILCLGLNNAFSQNEKALPAPINTAKFTEYAPSISADGKTLIFESDRQGDWKLFESKRNGKIWSVPTAIPKITTTFFEL